MHIALLTNGLFPWAVGGMQKHSSNLIREWVLMGVGLDVYFAQAPSYPPVVEIQEALVPAEAAGRVRFFASAPSWLPYFPLHHYADCYVESCRMAERFLRDSAGADFVYAQGFTGYRLVQMKQKGTPLPPIGANLHGLEDLQDFQSGFQERVLKFASRPMTKWLLQHADVALSLGGKLNDLIREVAPDVRILHSGNGVSVEWCANSVVAHTGPRRFAFVGRYTRRKGLHILYEAIRGMPSSQKFEFHLVGDIVQSDRLNDARLIYHGPITEESRMRKLLREMDVLVCPSLAEGVPTVVLEGMASGLAIIATDVGATQDLVDESNGLLITPGSVVTLRKALGAFLGVEDAVLYRLQWCSVEKARHFLWPSVANATFEGIRRLVRENSVSADLESRCVGMK